LLLLGVAEDITGRVGVRIRLVFGLVVAALAYFMAGVQVTRLDLPGVDELMLGIPLLSFGFTLVAVCGLVHAMNIVDGLNGLLAGISLIAFGCVSFVARQHGENALMLIGLATMAATVGFGLFNFPRARLFSGDGGAYLLGYMLATLVILLVLRRPEISPWFSMAVIIHPVTETLYSAFRRWRDGLSPGNADAKHLHSLWSARLRDRESLTGSPVWLGSNAGAAVRCVTLAGIPCLLAAACPTQTMLLQAICVVYVVVYLIVTRLLSAPAKTVIPMATHRQPE
jgi:UDP-GlcNAc:undecaprenyl-phosphate GlcNAc-1-phosphate transferase